MSFALRQLPTIQQWSCHQCASCCREHFVEVTAAEKQRIESQGWSQRPDLARRPLFERYGRGRFRLAHQPDGSCVFLDAAGGCRIHAEYGLAAKPLACQLYPYVLVPVGEDVRVGLRYSCPSAVRNLGEPVTAQRDELERLLGELTARGEQSPPPPPIRPGQQLDWPDTLRVAAAFEQLLHAAGADLPRRLIQVLTVARWLETARFDDVRGEKLDQLLKLLRLAAAEEVPADWASLPQPSRRALTLLRLSVAQYARKDVSPDLRRGWRGRWQLLRAAVRFTRGRGAIPPLQPQFGPATFEQVQRPWEDLPAEAWPLLERYYRVKIASMQFCGAACFGIPVIEGLNALVLTYPVLHWLARWHAAGAGRAALVWDDLATALSVLDHHFGFNPVFGYFYSRSRVRLLAQTRELERLVAATAPAPPRPRATAP
jgi:lysine-N-methylase